MRFLPSATREISNPIVERMASMVNESDAVLDIGCVQHDADKSNDPFWLHDRLVEKCDTVVGLDYEREEVNELNDRGYDIVVGDAQDFHIEETSDTVVAGEIIEHLTNVGSFLRSVASHLEPDGRLILSTPNTFHAYNIFESLTNDISMNPEHVAFYDPETLRNALEREGYEIQSLEMVAASKFEPEFCDMNLKYFGMKFFEKVGFELLGGYRIIVEASLQSDSQTGV